MTDWNAVANQNTPQPLPIKLRSLAMVQIAVHDALNSIDARYAPIPKDTRAILRQKTLLGETYVELSPGTASSGRVADGGDLERRI